MDLDKFSEKYYKIGTRKEISETAKITKISLAVLICSFVVCLLSLGINVKTPFFLVFFIFIFLLSAIVFALSYVFTLIMTFISKQPRKQKYLRIICYLLLTAFIVMLFVTAVVEVYKAINVISSLGGELTQETLSLMVNELTNGLRVYIIVLVLIEFLFEVSILLSFELKSLEDNIIGVFALGVYLAIALAGFLFNFITDNFQFALPLSLTFNVLWLLCLSLLLKDRTTDVACLVRIDQDGNEIKEEQPEKKKRKILTKKLKIAIEISLVVVALILASLTFVIEGHLACIPLGFEIFIVAFAVAFAFYLLSGKKLRKIDLFGCAGVTIGLVLLLVNYLLLKSLSIALIIILGIISLVLIVFGTTTLFFFQKNSKNKYFIIKCVVFAIFSIVQIFYLANFFFAPELREQLGHIIPVIYVANVLIISVAYFLQVKRSN